MLSNVDDESSVVGRKLLLDLDGLLFPNPNPLDFGGGVAQISFRSVPWDYMVGASL